MSMKNPVTPGGIEPATFQIVAQHLNHCATAVPMYICISWKIKYIFTDYEKKLRSAYENIRIYYIITVENSCFFFEVL